MIALNTPGVDDLGETIDGLRTMQHNGIPAQLHPGDLGWQWRLGAAATAVAVRTWRRDGRTVAVGMLDNPRLPRLAHDVDRSPDSPRWASCTI